VTDVKVKVISSRKIQVSWKPALDVGSGIIGHDILYNRQDIPAMERHWKVHKTQKSELYKVTLDGLSPNRPYEIKVYARTSESRGVPSETVNADTLPDGK